MNIEIDQSGKIENTNKDTVIAFSDDYFSSILIKAKDKREIQKIFRQIGKPRMFVDYLLTQIRKIKPDFNKNDINFKRIGKKSRVHLLAYQVFTGKRKSDVGVKAKDILKFILK